MGVWWAPLCFPAGVHPFPCGKQVVGHILRPVWCVWLSSSAKVVTCHASWPVAGERMGWAPHTWNLHVPFPPFVEACWDLTFALLWGGRRSETACIAEGTAAHLPSQAGGTAVQAAIISSSPPACCLDEQGVTWGLKSAAVKSLTWLFCLKGGRDQVWLCSRFSSSVLLGKHLLVLSLC